MVFLIVFLVIVIVAIGVSFWPADPVNPGDGKDAAPENGGSGPGAAATTLEGVLAAQLIEGQISQPQYHRALALLAARDDERNPVSVPGKDRPDACA